MFLVSLGKCQSTDIMNYYDIIKRLVMQLQRESELKNKGQALLFRNINDHTTIKVINSSYEVLVNWEYGNVTWEHASVMRSDDPIYISKYASYNELLDKPGRKQICRYVNNTKNMNRLLKAAKAKQLRNTVNIKSGMKILCDHKEEMMFDSKTATTIGRMPSYSN